jgi:hypothetical protein
MPSTPSWLLSWLLNEVAEYGGARTKPPNFDFAVAIEGWPSHVTCLPAIVYDYIHTLFGSICLFNGCESVVKVVVGLLRVMIPSARERHASSLSSLLKMRILVVTPSLVVLPMVVPPSSAKTVLVLSLILV